MPAASPDSRPTLIQFGAGNIGRGFIAPVFCAAGWRVVFVDLAQAVVAELNQRGTYTVFEVDNAGERPVAVGPVSAIDGRDLEAVAAAVASADLVATAVGLAAMPHLGRPIAEGLRRRDPQRPLDVLVCENGLSATADLRRAVLAILPEADARLGTVRTSIGRMIPPPAQPTAPSDFSSSSIPHRGPRSEANGGGAGAAAGGSRPKACDLRSGAGRPPEERWADRMGEALPPTRQIAQQSDASEDQGRGAGPKARGGEAPNNLRGEAPNKLRVEPYCHLPVERAAFRGAVPQVAHLEAVDDFELVIRQKLYLHNLTHACLAYAGHLRGCATIPDCLEIPDLAAAARQAGGEAAEALALAHGAGDPARVAAVRADCLALVEDLFQRYRNRALSDPVARVARDPQRKLAADDRLVGAARLCVEQGVPFPALALHLALACRYTPAADEPGRDRFIALRSQGWRVQLAELAGLSLKDPIMTAVASATERDRIERFKSALPGRRSAAAAAMRAAGLVLRDDEAAAVEIADFGLDQFERYGLAIHVYVNTDRVCGKELVMLPGQMCPEHRHPPIDGDPGKEETFRCRQGEVFLYLPGHKQGSGEREAALRHVDPAKHAVHTMYKLVHLKPGDQWTLKPNTPHWFAAGPNGAVVSEFSTRSRDEADIFTDPAIVRLPPE
ncbi:hypothetical protein LBMAG53_03550 [Planctomycetota bacterium]|nr:hypothetical protein LBMAG53_03550 [Planctomycetota bacterium]